MDREQIRDFVRDKGIRFILAQFVDVHGVAKTKAVPAAHLEDLFDGGAGFAGFALWGMGQQPHDPDFIAMPDAASFTHLPHKPHVARVACDGHVKGEPWPCCARTVLKRAIARGREAGYTFHTGIEPEFFLLRRGEDGSIAPADPGDRLDKPCYDYKGISRGFSFIDQLVSVLDEVGFDVYQVDHEDANGQFEINYQYDECLASADKYIFFKMAATDLAREMGLIVSFMPKPFAHRTGNSAHFHMSLTDESGENVFADPADRRELGLSQVAYHFLGGLLAHASALVAVTSPSVNSYKRMVVGGTRSGATWAPAYVSYGDNNRTMMMRVPGPGRLECRAVDSAANPYLATAALLAAGLDGIEKQIDPGEPLNINVYNLTLAEIRARGIAILPQNLGEALDAFSADPVIRGALGEDLAQQFVQVKQSEWAEYQRHVSDWEIERYLELY